jgi:HEAT repeat protein
MITYYCPECWQVISEKDTRCPHCNYDLSRFNELTFEQKLLRSLDHPVVEMRIIAARTLGDLGYVDALPYFEKMLDQEKVDYYLLRAVLEATAKINHPQAMRILQRAKEHPSSLIRRLAAELIEKRAGELASDIGGG